MQGIDGRACVTVTSEHIGYWVHYCVNVVSRARLFSMHTVAIASSKTFGCGYWSGRSLRSNYVHGSRVKMRPLTTQCSCIQFAPEGWSVALCSMMELKCAMFSK